MHQNSSSVPGLQEVLITHTSSKVHNRNTTEINKKTRYDKKVADPSKDLGTHSGSYPQSLWHQPCPRSSLSEHQKTWCVKYVLAAESCPTLCYPIDCNPPGSSVHRILQVKILDCVAISFSRGSSLPRDQIWVSCIAADSLPSEPPGISSQKPQVWKCQHLGAYFRAKSFRRDTSSTLQKKVNNKKQILWLLSREGEHAKFTLDKQLKLYCHVSTFQSENKHDRCSFGCSSTFHLNGNSSSLRLQPEVIIYYCFCIIPLPRQKAECSTYISRPMRGNKV